VVPQAVLQPVLVLLRKQRFGEQVTLGMVATGGSCQVSLRLGLDAFGSDPDAEFVGHDDEALGNASTRKHWTSQPIRIVVKRPGRCLDGTAGTDTRPMFLTGLGWWLESRELV
jgi:hypothetical protein